MFHAGTVADDLEVTLARGALRMVRKQVIVKRLSAIHDLGSMALVRSWVPPPYQSMRFETWDRGTDMRQFLQLVALATVMIGLALVATPGAYAQGAQGPQTAKGKAMQGFVGDIEELSEKNSDFRRVLYTGKNLQLVVMTLKPGEEIGEEVHEDGDQFFRVEEGEGEVLIDGKRSRIKSGYAILIPAGARHNIMNTGKETLHVYTLYAPPEHRDKTVHATKDDANKSSEHFDGKPTE